MRRSYDHGHICGCYFVLPHISYQRHYLPQVGLQSHTTITPVSFSTKLQQKFSNTQEKTIDEIRYVFPLYDGVSVGAYTIRYGDKSLKGVVKQKDDARQTFQAAVDRGETAGLLESLPAGVFGVTIGNVPAKTDIYVDIEYVGELKHDAGIDGLRYTLPTSICPRYGSYPGQLSHTPTSNTNGIKVTLDIDMGGSAMRKVQSPTHPIAFTMGNLSTAAATSAFDPSKGSATLAQSSAELGKDFVLQLLIDDISSPQAIIEQHPTVDSRAIMATLVPKFNLPLSSPELIFIADQSGSMMGNKNEQLKASLKIFLKSLPFGIRFNICAFGSHFRYLWDKSQSYNEDNLKTASDFVDTLNAQYGGTEMYEPVKQAFERRLGDLPLEIMLLTDGEIWQEQELFTMINKYIHEDVVDARVFGLGIGDDVSHTLVEGIARAGNGFAQFVVQNEESDAKIVRMLRASLLPHTKDYTLEITYGDSTSTDDDFELVEKVSNELHIGDEIPTTSEKTATSFFDESTNSDAPIQSAERYSHLPTVAIPKVLQAPTKIAPLFPFNRSTVYLLLGPDAPKQDVINVTLRAQAPSGPLELKVPVHKAAGGTSVHQLAARKATQELEEGRGWIQEAKTVDGQAVKENYQSRLDELAEREAVRLGTTYQVANKWCSFVSVQDGSEQAEAEAAQPVDNLYAHVVLGQSQPMMAQRAPAAGIANASMFGGGARGGARRLFRAVQSPAPAPAPASQPAMQRQGLFGAASSTASMSTGFGMGQPSTLGIQTFSTPSAAMQAVPPPPASSGSTFGAAPGAMPPMVGRSAPSGKTRKKRMAGPPAADVAAPLAPPKLDTSAGRLRAIIGEQSFAGYWEWNDNLREYIEASSHVGDIPEMNDADATALVLAYLRTRMTDLKDVWEMVAEKAVAWLEATEGKERSDELQHRAGIAIAA